jgi:hypothetical protein
MLRFSGTPYIFFPRYFLAISPDVSIKAIQKFVGIIPQFLWGKRPNTQKRQERRKSRKNVRNLMIFKHNSYQAELKLYAKFC